MGQRCKTLFKKKAGRPLKEGAPRELIQVFIGDRRRHDDVF